MSKLKISRRMITLIVGIGCAVIAVVVALSLMLGSYGSWKGYYDRLMAEREHQKYLESLPLEFTGISAALADGVVFYDNGTADPEAYDFTVSANFTEKGREFSRKLSLGDYSIEVPDDFADHGGAVTVSYTWQPEKAEDAAEDDPLPDPITKTTQVNISLVAPDETVYKVTAMPTFFEPGEAENMNGDKVTLPRLNDTNYTYTEYVTEKFTRFDYAEPKITIKKPLVAELAYKLVGADAEIEVNNVNCHFAVDMPNASFSFDDDSSAFVITPDAENTVEFASLKSDNLTIAGSGKVSLTGSTLTTKVLVVKSGASLSIQGVGTAIESSSILFEAGSDVTCLTTEDSIKLRGTAKLFGTLLIKDKDGNTDKTAVNIPVDGVTIELARSSRITIDSFTYAFGQFSGELRNAQVLMPYGTFAKLSGDLGEGERAGWFIVDGSDRQDIMTLKNITDAATMKVAIVMPSLEGVTVEQQPTPTTTGKATTEDGSTIVLPVLSAKNYAFEEKTDNVVTFTHYETAISFDVTVDGERLTIDGTAYNKLTAQTHLSTADMAVTYDDVNGFTISVAEGKTAEFTSLSGNKLVIAGKGKVSLTGSTLTAESLTVRGGASLSIQGVGTAINAASVLFEADSDVTCLTSENGIMLRGNAKLFGTLTVRDQNGNTDKTGMEVLANDVSIELAETSSVTFESFTYGIGRFGAYTNPTVLLPYGTEQTDSGSLEAGEKASWYVTGEDEQTHKILVMKNITEGSFCNASEKVMDYESVYTVVKAPTATETGLAVADDMDDVILPVLSKAEYAFTEGENNVVTFTHYKTGLSFDVTVEGERLTVDGTVYNKITAQTHLSSADMAVTYDDENGYNLSVNEGSEVTFGNMKADKITLSGKGALTLTAANNALTTTDLVVSDGTLNITATTHSAIVTENMTIAEGAAVNVTAPGTTSGLNMLIFNGNIVINGTLSAVNTGANGSTAITPNKSTALMDITIGENAYVHIENFEVGIGVWEGNAANGKLHLPGGATRSATEEGPDPNLNTFGYYVGDGQGEEDYIIKCVNIARNYLYFPRVDVIIGQTA